MGCKTIFREAHEKRRTFPPGVCQIPMTADFIFSRTPLNE
jgi:hypothetical protein